MYSQSLFYKEKEELNFALCE